MILAYRPPLPSFMPDVRCADIGACIRSGVYETAPRGQKLLQRMRDT
jgi:hypothetical protein